MFCFGFLFFLKKLDLVGWSHGGIVGSRLVLVLVWIKLSPTHFARWLVLVDPIKLSPTHFAKKKRFNATQKKEY